MLFLVSNFQHWIQKYTKLYLYIEESDNIFLNMSMNMFIHNNNNIHNNFYYHLHFCNIFRTQKMAHTNCRKLETKNMVLVCTLTRMTGIQKSIFYLYAHYIGHIGKKNSFFAHFSINASIYAFLYKYQYLSSEHGGAQPLSKLRQKRCPAGALLELTVNCPKFSVLFRTFNEPNQPIYSQTRSR